MIDICLGKLKDLPDNIQNRVIIQRGDIRDFDLSQRFDVIICPGNTFPLLLSAEERESALRAIHEHMKEPGFVILDIWKKDLSMLCPGWNLWAYEVRQKFNPVLGRSLSWCEYVTIEKKQAIELVRNSPIVKECYDAASDYCSQACRNLELLPQNASRQALTELAAYVIKREE